MHQPEKRGEYRPEIDGLRALAVVAVILYHAGMPTWHGGFLGVDIFLAISGYLITGIILRDLEASRFTLTNFYVRRIRRILPALMLISAICIGPSLYLMMADELENFGQSLVATATSSNNILMMLTSNYFQLLNEFKPLMHTWSLGVEEQYYILVPVLYLVSHQAGGRRGVWVATAVVGLASLITCLLTAPMHPVGNFFLLNGRAWELSFGAMAALSEPVIREKLVRRPMLAGTLSCSGLVIAVISILTLGKHAGTPGPASLVPLVGTCLVLVAASPQDPAGRLLSWRPIRFLGLTSYSAYLIHQPLFAFIRLWWPERIWSWYLAAMTPAVFGLAWLSWKYIENPFRTRRLATARSALGFAALTGAMLVSVGLVFHVTHGFASRRDMLHPDDQRLDIRSAAAFNGEPFVWLHRTFTDDGRIRILVFGNSYARDFMNMIQSSPHSDQVQFHYDNRDECAELEEHLKAEARRAHLIVLASGVIAERLPCMKRLVVLFQQVSHAPVVVLGTKQFGWNYNAVMRRPIKTLYETRVRPLPEYIEANEIGKAAFSSDMYVDLLGMLSDSDGKVPLFTPDRRLISRDTEHLTPVGARFLGEKMLQHKAFAMLRSGRDQPSTQTPDADNRQR